MTYVQAPLPTAHTQHTNTTPVSKYSRTYAHMQTKTQCIRICNLIFSVCVRACQPLYANLINPKWSKSELINHGDFKTHAQLRHEAEQACCVCMYASVRIEDKSDVLKNSFGYFMSSYVHINIICIMYMCLCTLYKGI